MSNIIEMALNHLELNMPDIQDIDMLEMRIKEFLETCLHDKFDVSDVIAHGDVEITVTRAKDREADTIKMLHNGVAYIVMYRYGRGNVFTMAENYWNSFRDSFHETYMDEAYVDAVICTLITALMENHFLYLV